MKKLYISPAFETLHILSSEKILTGSEESFDIEVSFDELWGI